MTQSFEFKQSGHLNPALSEPATGTLHAEKLTGRWLNTNMETQGIAEILIEQDNDAFHVSVFGVGENDDRVAWPMMQAKVLANLEEEAGQRAVALAATFNFGFMKAETYFRVNKGVLVIVMSNTFQDESGRSNYVNREFFYRQD